MQRLLAFASLLVLALFAAACSVGFSLGGETADEAAVELIESEEMALRLDVDAITNAVCEEPVDDEVGTVFACTAQSGGQTIDFDVDIEEDNRIFASPQNVLPLEILVQFEDQAVLALNEANGWSVPVDAMDCGGRVMILDEANAMICALTDPDTGVVFDAQITVKDVDPGRFDVAVLGEAAEQP